MFTSAWHMTWKTLQEHGLSSIREHKTKMQDKVRKVGLSNSFQHNRHFEEK